jgi:hypothetical protein
MFNLISYKLQCSTGGIFVCVLLSFLCVPDSTPDKPAELLLESDDVMSR